MKLKITVHGVAYEVDVEVLDAGEGFPAAGQSRPRHNRANSNSQTAPPPPKPSAAPSPSPAGAGSVASPIAGTIIEVKCKIGDQVSDGQLLMVIEAMKMKTSIAAPTSGKIKAIPVAAGDAVRENQILVEFE